MLHLLEAFAENLFHLFVPVRKLAEHLAQQPGDFLIRQGHDARDDSPRDVVGGGTKRAHQHARAIRGQRRPDAFGVEGGGWLFGHEFISALESTPGITSPTGSLKLVRVFCSACISASDEQEGQRGFGALILAQPVHVQAVATAAGGRIVERQAQIVPAEEPLERAARFRDPEHVARGLIRFDAGGNRGLGFDGLLVENARVPCRADKIRSSRWAGTSRPPKSES